MRVGEDLAMKGKQSQGPGCADLRSPALGILTHSPASYFFQIPSR